MDTLKNIVLLSSNEDEFIQMLGRKRVSDNEVVNLYIFRRDQKYFTQRLHNVNKRLSAISLYKKNLHSLLKEYYQEIDYEKIKVVKGLFYYDKNNKLCLNWIAEAQLKSELSFLTNIINKLSIDQDAFIKQQLHWLNLGKTFSVTNYVNHQQSLDNKNEFALFFENLVNVPIPKEKQEAFYRKVKDLYHAAYGKRKNDRAERSYGPYKIREIFNELKLNYLLTFKDSLLRIERKY